MSTRTPAADLCISCQMCCNGSLFRSISISAAESQRLEQHEPGICNGSTSDLPTPCIALSRFEGCTLYHLRPNSCAKFTCSVLHRANTGAITEEKAHHIIEKAKDLQAEATAYHADENEQAKAAFKS